jgi:FMN-dependent NADH-azoreductase
MSRLLHIDASPRGAQSHSQRAAGEFIACLREQQPDLTVDRLAVWEETLPDFDGPTLSAKYARLAGRPHCAGEARAWSVIEQLVARLRAADRIVIATPMWNLSIPYRLKQLIDLVTQPGLTFSFDPASGYAPLLESRPVLVILASAGDFSSGLSWGRPDLATPYLRQALAFIGLHDCRVVGLGPTAGDPAQVARGALAARAALQRHVPGFLDGEGRA